MKLLLKKLAILQEVSNKNRVNKLGRGFSAAKRLNPFNPLSYLTIVLVFVAALVLFGIVGMWKEIVIKNPFKWY